MTHRWWPLLAALSCARPAPPTPPTPAPSPGVVAAPTPEEGFVFRLTQANEAPDAGADRAALAPANPLPKGVVDALLARLPALPAAPTSEFQVRPGSAPPPKTATPVDVPFPAPEPAAAPEVITGPLQVTRHQPDGDVPLAPQVSIIFNHPMIPLTTQDFATQGAAGPGGPPSVPVVLTPAVEGQWRWVGTKTLLFEPPVRMPAATRYTLAVPAGTTAADGATLITPMSYTFTTPPVGLRGSAPSGGGNPLSPVIALRFDQQVHPGTLAERVELRAAGAVHPARLATAEEIDADPAARAALAGALDGTWVALKPSNPLPYDASVEVVLPKGSPSAEGPLGTTADQRFTFNTHGPLRLAQSRCGWDSVCRPGMTWELQFTNALAVDDAAALVKIEPALPDAQVWAEGGAIYVEGLATPRTVYKVTVDGALVDTFGQSMGAPASASFNVADPEPMQPMIALAGPNPQIADPFGSPKVSFYTGALTKARLRVHAVQPEDLARYTDMAWYNPEAPELPGKVVVDEVRPLPADTGMPALYEIDLAPYLTTGHGHLVVELAGTTGNRWDRPGARVWVTATHLGVHATWDASAATVWATDLKTGRPVEGATVRLIGSDGVATTDANGRATLTALRGEGPFVVEREGDSTIATPAGSLYLYDGWLPDPGGLQTGWFVFDDRHLYRPGEQVSVKGWARTIDTRKGGDLQPPGDLQGGASWVATDSNGVELARGEAQLTPWNGFDFRFTLPSTPALGSAWITLTLANGESRSHVFEIQEFRRPEFEVTAQVDSAGPHVVGGEAVLSASAKYFAGGPLPGADVAWEVSSSVTDWHPAGWDTFRFGRWEPPWWSWRPWGDRSEPGASQSLSATTDATGTHRLTVHLDRMGRPRTMSLHAEATVQDTNRQAWAAAADLLVHPADRYVGLKTDKGWYKPGDVMTVESIVTDLDGAATAGVPVSLELIRKEWKRTRGDWNETETLVGTCVVTSAASPQPCKFKPEAGGQHVLRAGLTDAAGRANETEVTLWVSGGTLEQVSGVEAQQLMLIADQETYAPGDTAHVAVQAPFAPGLATITIDRAGVLSVEERWITETAFTVDVPITEAHIPDLHVQVQLVGATARAEVEPGGPTLRPALASGAAALKVPPRSRTLQVQVVPLRKAFSPGETVPLDAFVTDAAGKPVVGAEVALVMVDEAVLALGGGEIPDPVAAFYPDRGAGTATAENRTWIVLDETTQKPATETRTTAVARGGRAMVYKSAVAMEAMPAPMAPMESGASFDGDAAPQPSGPPIAVRKDFSALAVWAPASTTDARGRVHVDAKLPDNLTRYRITAVAVDRDRSFGKGEADVTARLPLMLRPSPPRFLNFGDTAELPLVIQNQTEQVMTVDVALRASNVLVEGGDRGGRRVVVPANDRVEVRLPIAAQQAGKAFFQAAAATGSWSDAASFELPVWTPATSEAFATYGTLDGPAGMSALRQPVNVPGDVWPQFGGLEISTSSTALSALTDAVIQLVDYPYGCVEQIGSRMIAVAALKDVLAAFDAEGLPDAAALTSMVQADIEELTRRQHDDGAWGWWDRNPRYASPFTTLHATHALLRARAAGYDVPQRTLDRALNRVRNIEAMFDPRWSPQLKAALQANAVMVRGLAGEPGAAGDALALFRKHGTAGLSLDALGWILPSLHAQRASAEITEIRTLLANRVAETAATAQFTLSYGESEDALILASSRRTDAILLDALLQTRPDDDLLPKLVAGLLDGRKKGHWGSTQEDGWVLLALNRYFRVAEAVTPDLVARAWLGPTYAGDHAFRGRTTESANIQVPMSLLAGKGPQDLVVARDGAGRLYYRLGLRYAPKSLNLDPAERGFSVTRRYEGVDDPNDVRRDADGTWRVKAGARVRVTLTMEAPGRRYHVALVDPMPAGFEALNPAFAMTGDVPVNPPNDEDAARGWWWGPWYEHENLRDERVEAFAQTVWGGVYTYRYVARATTPGRFVVPPAKAEEMYHPETFGRTGTAYVVVQ